MPLRLFASRSLARRLGAAAVLLAGCERAPATAPAAAALDRAAEGAGNAGGGLPARYVLPGDRVFPEGVATDVSSGTVYVTSTTDGTVFRGTLGDSLLSVFLPGGADERTTAVGVAVDPRRDRLFVAGGGTGRVFVYDANSGALLARLEGGAGDTFVNDIAVASDGVAYATDSRRPVVYRVAPAAAGGYTIERWLDLTRTVIQYRTAPGQFNLNGIEATENGRYLYTVQSNTGQLFRIDTQTRAVVAVDLGGESLANGDGLFLRGATLYAVQNAQGVIAEVKVQSHNGPSPRGRVVSRTGDPSFRFPTTIDEARGRLLVVNSQFNRRGPGLTPERPFTLSVVKP